MDFLGIPYGPFTATEDNTDSVNTTQNLRRVVIGNGARRYRLAISLLPDYKKGYGGKLSAHRSAFGLGVSFPVIMPQWISPDAKLLASRINTDPDLQGLTVRVTSVVGRTTVNLLSSTSRAADIAKALEGRYVNFSNVSLRRPFPQAQGKVYQILSATASSSTITITLCQPLLLTVRAGSYYVRFNPYIQVYYESVVALSTEMQANKLVRSTLELLEAL